jgi:hypothetical protein
MKAKRWERRWPYEWAQSSGKAYAEHVRIPRRLPQAEGVPVHNIHDGLESIKRNHP